MAKILVIEDNPVDAKMIRTNLKAEGYQVIGADNGKDGIKLAQKKKPDLIIMDMILPGMHGLEASIKLKENPETKKIPIIAVTVMDSSDFIRECYKEGISAFIKKPYDFKELFNTIEKNIGNQKMAKKILIIDNDPTLTTMITMSLARHGYQMISASDGKDGVNQAHMERPDLILLDKAMPGEGGITVFEELKKSDITMSIPIILMTDQLSPEEIEKSETQSGAEDYITKPFASLEVIHKTKKILDQ